MSVEVKIAWPAARPMAQDQSGSAVGLDVGHGHAGTFGGEQLGHGCPDARGASADPGDLSFESTRGHSGFIREVSSRMRKKHNRDSGRLLAQAITMPAAMIEPPSASPQLPRGG